MPPNLSFARPRVKSKGKMLTKEKPILTVVGITGNFRFTNPLNS